MLCFGAMGQSSALTRLKSQCARRQGGLPAHLWMATLLLPRLLDSPRSTLPHRTAAAGTAARATRRQGGRGRALVENRTASDVGSQLRLL